MKAPVSLLALIASLGAVASLPAADKNQTWTDPAKAAEEDPDFKIQGEYVGGKGEDRIGVQVVALGDGAFDAYFLEGGLPGDGWEPGQERVKVGSRKGRENEVLFGEKGGDGPVAVSLPGGLQVTWKGTTVALKRVERTSPTLGMEPPEGAVVLFDGTDAEHWKNGKVVDGLLAATGTTSIPTFKDCTIHIEFRTPYKPKARGQGRGNSGIYFMGRWETQVLDSFGLEGKENECGGIYSVAPPKLNMCLPPLTWQTYDVEYTAPTFDENGERTAWPRMTVKLNGVVVHDDQELAKPGTTAAPVKGPLTDEGGPIYLQAHGNPVFYRNIWVLPKE